MKNQKTARKDQPEPIKRGEGVKPTAPPPPPPGQYIPKPKPNPKKGDAGRSS